MCIEGNHPAQKHLCNSIRSYISRAAMPLTLCVARAGHLGNEKQQGVIRRRLHATVRRPGRYLRLRIGSTHTARTAPAVPATKLRVQWDANWGRTHMSTPETTTPITNLRSRLMLTGSTFAFSLVPICQNCDDAEPRLYGCWFVYQMCSSSASYSCSPLIIRGLILG